MSKQLSFSPLANKYLKNFRDKINNSEDKVDLTNNFSLIICQLLKEVFGDNAAEINDNDVVFEPDVDLLYKINPKLSERDFFQEIWNCSDLPNLIMNFAKSTHHRYLHLAKHPEKSQKKIRN